MKDERLWSLTVASLGHAYRNDGLSPVAVTEACLRRIDALNERLGAYITVTSEVALTAAHAAEARYAQGRCLGPLDGVPIALKDLINTAGIRTTAQSALCAERIPHIDATVVQVLKSAGAVLLGKTTLHEFGTGAAEVDGPFSAARNPWNPERIPGGSSSGSAAAVAAGLCPAALGTDTGGSIRIPGSYCGIVGFKPTFGLISRHGVIPLSWSLDHVGLMARTVEDVSILLSALARFDPDDPDSIRVAVSRSHSDLGRTISGLRVGVPADHLAGAQDLHPATRAAFGEALAVLKRLGAEIEPVALPDRDLISAVYFVIVGAEALAFHEREARQNAHLFGSTFYMRLLEGALLTAADYVQALRGRTLLRRMMSDIMHSIDVLAMPTTPHPAPDFSSDAVASRWERVLFTPLFNLTGQPAISVPCGMSEEGLPVGLQLVARPQADAELLAVAHAFQQASSWLKGVAPLWMT